MGRQGDSRGHLTHAPAPGQCLPSAFSRCLGTEQSFSLDLGAEPEAGSAPHRLWVLYARKHRGLKVRKIRVPEMPGVSSSCLTGGNQVYRGEPLAQGHRHLAGPGLGPRPFALHLSVARELEQLQGASWAQRGAGAWGEEQAGTLVARAPPGEGEALLLPGERGREGREEGKQ